MRFRSALVIVVAIATMATARQARAAEPGARAAPAADFAAQARLLWRVTACGGGDAVPERLPKKIIDANCKQLGKVYARFADRWIAVAAPFFAKVRPQQLPDRVLYPFGGGDLLFALVVFPDATEITSLGLERAGDVRIIDAISKADFKIALDDTTFMITRLASVEYSFTEHMIEKQGSLLPVQISMALAALAALGYEPLSLRYFVIEADGSLRYLSAAEIEASQPAKKLKKKQPGGHIAKVFANVEISFRRLGDAKAPVKVYRSIAANAADGALKKDGRLLEHLRSRGPVAVMVKAASYLLWRDDFAQMRGVLLANTVWMVSDSTGMLPMHAEPAGFEMEAWGVFRGSLLGTDKDKNADMKALFKRQPARELPFRFGYPDWKKEGGHLVITRRKR